MIVMVVMAMAVQGQALQPSHYTNFLCISPSCQVKDIVRRKRGGGGRGGGAMVLSYCIQ